MIQNDLNYRHLVTFFNSRRCVEVGCGRLLVMGSERKTKLSFSNEHFGKSESKICCLKEFDIGAQLRPSDISDTSVKHTNIFDIEY